MSLGHIQKPCIDGTSVLSCSPEGKHLRSILADRRSSPPNGSGSIKHEASQPKLLSWYSLKRACLDDESRPGIGVCMIAFSIPLLVPGITLTVVAFDDETGFSKYSALHVLGMLMLAASCLLLIAGVMMHVKFRSKVSPEVQLHIVSTHEKSAKDLRTEATFDHPHTTKDDLFCSESGRNSIHPANFMIDAGNILAGGDHHVHFTNHKVGSGPNRDSLSSNSVLDEHRVKTPQLEHDDYMTSSDDDQDDTSSVDSEDASSGSYLVLDPHDGKRHSGVSEHSRLSHDKVSHVGPGVLQNSMYQFEGSTLPPGTHETQIRDHHPSLDVLFSTNNHNFQGYGGYKNETSQNEPKMFCNPLMIATLRDHSGKKNAITSDHEKKHGMSSDDLNIVQSGAGSPSSRQRLQALRSNTNSPSGPPLLNEHTNGVFSFEEDAEKGGSEASVFIKEDDRLQTLQTTSATTTTATSVSIDGQAPSVRWSMPVIKEGNPVVPQHVTVRQANGALSRTRSLGQEHITGSQVASRNPDSCEDHDSSKTVLETKSSSNNTSISCNSNSTTQKSTPCVRSKYTKRRFF